MLLILTLAAEKQICIQLQKAITVRAERDVAAQLPSAGAALTGRPITLTSLVG